MNERIKELAEQAEQYAHEQNDKHGVRFKTEYNRKFAELIVKECIEQVWYTREEMIDETISQNIKARMADHLGVTYGQPN